MSNLLLDGAQWLADQQKAYAGTSITYTRGAFSVTLTATVGKTDTRLGDLTAGRVRTEWADKDYLIHAADLILNAAAITPAAGDQITEGSEVREVVPMDAEPHSRASDPYSIRLRIHTKRIA